MEIAVVTPVYNDWESFFMLVGAIKGNEQLRPHNISIFAVNDCSSDHLPTPRMDELKGVTILHGVRNLGHQKAIAIGLSHVQTHKQYDAVIVMDADGEDRPEDIHALLVEHQSTPANIIFAKRTKRYEKGAFKGFYLLYKAMFGIVTGENINFGNFSLIPGQVLYRVVHLSEIWNNYPGGIMRSKLPYKSIGVQRGARYFGESKMNFVTLVIHGLSGMSVYLDVISVRLLIIQIVVALLLALALAGITLAALFANILVPQWLVTLAFMIGMAFMINLFMSFMLTFMVLHYRSQHTFIPKYDATRFIEKVESH